MTTRQHPPDAELKCHILEELRWTPNLNQTEIGVSVSDGAVTLSGEVTSYLQKLDAQKAVQRVHGVHGVAQEMTVRSTYTVNDTDLARAAGSAIERDIAVPGGAVNISVEHGVVTLAGSVAWHYQRESAERAVRHLRGIHDVRNNIALRPVVLSSGIKTAIAAALMRNASIDARRCTVIATSDGAVTLEGSVTSWAQREQAERVAWAAPGVRTVANGLRITERPAPGLSG